MLVFVANQVANIANGMSWQDIWQRMGQQSRMTILLMILAGLLGVTPMLLYDWVTIRVLEKQGKPKWKERVSSCCVGNKHDQQSPVWWCGRSKSAG